MLHIFAADAQRTSYRERRAAGMQVALMPAPRENRGRAARNVRTRKRTEAFGFF